MDFSYLKELMDYMALERSPGSAVNIYLGGELVYEYASGYSDLEAKTPFSCKNHVNIYSCSKVATVTAACQLLERGKFLLNEPRSFNPGTRWQYSLCHDVLAGFVEVISGMKFRDYHDNSSQ